MIWGGMLLAVALLASGVYWWIKRRQRTRLISFVALLREPVTFDSAVLTRLAAKAWNADLGDGTSEGADGFVACAGVVNTIVHEGRMFLINSFPQPYVEDVEQAASGIPDMRIRSLFSDHRAWFSCDALGVTARTPANDVLNWQQRLGKLLAELLDENCLLIYVPDTALAYPINEDTETALRSADPLRALRETLTVPTIEVSDDDPLMLEAVKRAREDWPRFVAAYEAEAGENFTVKAPVTHEETTEFIWISVTALEGDLVYGELGNDPVDLGPLKLGSKVSVPVAELNDWMYIDPAGNMVGGFTIEAVQKASGRRKKTGTNGE